MTSHGKEVYCRQMLFGVWRLTSFDILPAVTHCVARGAAMLACWCWVCVLWIWRLEFLLQKIISFTIRSPVFLCSGCGHAQTKTKLRTDINEAECVCVKILNWPEMCHLVARVHALVHWGRSSSCTCMWVFFLFFLGYRGGLFSGPRSLPIPRQVHMCFISRQACWTVNSDSRAGLGIRSAASLKPIAENKRQAQLFFFSLAESKKKSPNIFLFLDIQVTYTPHPHLFFAVPLYVPASHYDLLSSPQNWFIPRPTLHPHAAAHANSFGLFFYVSVSLLSSSAPVFFFFAASSPSHPPPPLLSVIRLSLCRQSWLCPCLSFCAAILRLQGRRKRKGWGGGTHNGKHLQRWSTTVSVGLGTSCSLFFFDVTHTHTDTDASSSTHITTTPSPITEIYVSSLIFHSLSSPSTWQSQLERDMAGRDPEPLRWPPEAPTPSSGCALCLQLYWRSESDDSNLKSKQQCTHFIQLNFIFAWFLHF